MTLRASGYAGLVTTFMPKISPRHTAAAETQAPFEFEGQDISVSKLLLDPNNYRFLDRKKFKKKAANRSHEESVQRATLESLEQSYQLDELKHSIITNGYRCIRLCCPRVADTLWRHTWIDVDRTVAKHYRRTQVTTGDVRELVGSKELLVAKIFSTVDERYKELRLRLYAPTAVALITTEEIPTTVRRPGSTARVVFVFAASDLFYLLGPILKKHTVAAMRTLIRKESKAIPTLA